MSPVGAQGPGGVELAAVARDDQLLDLLARRATAPADDAVAALLAAFAEEVDDGLAELLAERELPVPAEPTGVRRGRGLRVTSMALVVGATLSVSGVAAAVTGDPFAPYKGLVSAVAGEDQLPEQAARMAAMNHALRGTRAQIAHGDLAAARDRLDALTSRLASMTDLTRGERTALQARIDALEAALARAEAKAVTGAPAGAGKPASAGNPDRGRPTDAGKPDDSAGNQGGGGDAQPGRHDGDAAEKAKPSTKPHASSDKKADNQGTGGSTADESVAPDDATDDPAADDQTVEDPAAGDQGDTGADQGDPGLDQNGSSFGGGQSQKQD